MAPWVHKTFVDFLPKYLFIQRPLREDDEDEDEPDLNYNLDDAKEIDPFYVPKKEISKCSDSNTKYVAESPFLAYMSPQSGVGLSPAYFQDKSLR